MRTHLLLGEAEELRREEHLPRRRGRSREALC